MTITNLIEQIAAGWPAYLQRRVVDKTDAAYSLVVDQPQEVLRPLLVGYEHLIVKGSTGEGNITAAPWIALFDGRFTTSATTGYYIVYLFSVDMSTVTLTLAFGTTQFEKQFGGPKKAFPHMRSAAARLQEMFSPLIPADLARGPINLAAGQRQKLHYAYQQSAILSYAPYRIGALPAESQLIADLQELTRLYTEMVSDPLEATVERLVEAVVEPTPGDQTIVARNFEPRPSRKKTNANGSNRRNHRYSPESRKVGDAGERVVMKHEKERLTQAGRLAGRV
jgi:MrcB-like, N-terminal domain